MFEFGAGSLWAIGWRQHGPQSHPNFFWHTAGRLAGYLGDVKQLYARSSFLKPSPAQVQDTGKAKYAGSTPSR